VLQCAARRAQRLPVTQLEIATLGFAALNLVTYTLWWNKPLDVQCSYPINISNTSDYGVELGPGDCYKSIEGGIEGSTEQARLGPEVRTNKGLWEGFKFVAVAIGRTMMYSVGTALLGVIIRPVLALVLQLAYMAKGHDRVAPEAQRVATFYAGELGVVEKLQIMCISTTVTLLFGSIHCIAWSLQFPSRSEELLWRISSLAITLIPLLIAVLWIWGVGILKWNLRPVLEEISTYTTSLAGFLYVLARCALLIIVFTSLRALPPGAYDTVSWTTYIPHL